jgi:hypothetical protein
MHLNEIRRAAFARGSGIDDGDVVMSKWVLGFAAAGAIALLSLTAPALAAPKSDGVRNVEQVNLSARRYHRHYRYHHRRWARPYYGGWPYYGAYPAYRYGYAPAYYRPYYYRPYYYRPAPFFPFGPWW